MLGSHSDKITPEVTIEIIYSCLFHVFQYETLHVYIDVWGSSWGYYILFIENLWTITRTFLYIVRLRRQDDIWFVCGMWQRCYVRNITITTYWFHRNIASSYDLMIVT